ncbi:MAG: ribosome small subunit-dependent GTPase A [Sphingobacteriia bacterium]|nr:MAG: ribosome small subunit-dependent GTPase A [Sphingobacteriia bacterium]
MKARVYKSTGSWYQVKATDGQFYAARARGSFKQEGLLSTNPIAVGDWVDISVEAVAEQSAVIESIEDRHNYVARVSPHQKRLHHIIASNLDQALLMVTLRQPKTSSGFIDRFLVSCEAQHVPAVILFNKADLYREKEMAVFEAWKETYTAIGYPVLLCSMEAGVGLDEVKACLQGKTTLLSGHSGVGKSTLLNNLYPHLSLRTAEVSDWSGKGMHTTTFAEMFELDETSHIIDTPGIRELGIVDMEKAELAHYFPEMRARMAGCQFNGCAIKKAVGTEIADDRFVSYLNILDSLSTPSY